MITFFEGNIGAVNVFNHFEYTASDYRSSSQFMTRVSTMNTASVITATVSGGNCGGTAVVRFRPSEAVATYFRSGTQAGWQPITNVEVVSGTVNAIPNTVWTGSGSNTGFILARDQGATFASSYNPNNGWDYCNGNYGTSGHLQLSVTSSFFENTIGSPHVFNNFEYTSYHFVSSDRFLSRASGLTSSSLITATVSGGNCGGTASVQFGINSAIASYFRDGVQAQWQLLTDPRVISGTVNSIPNYIWTGSGSNTGFILSRDGIQSATFASSYNPNSGWDYCNGNYGTSGHISLTYTN